MKKMSAIVLIAFSLSGAAISIANDIE